MVAFSMPEHLGRYTYISHSKGRQLSFGILVLTCGNLFCRHPVSHVRGRVCLPVDFFVYMAGMDLATTNYSTKVLCLRESVIATALFDEKED